MCTYARLWYGAVVQLISADPPPFSFHYPRKTGLLAAYGAIRYRKQPAFRLPGRGAQAAGFALQAVGLVGASQFLPKLQVPLAFGGSGIRPAVAAKETAVEKSTMPATTPPGPVLAGASGGASAVSDRFHPGGCTRGRDLWGEARHKACHVLVFWAVGARRSLCNAIRHLGRSRGDAGRICCCGRAASGLAVPAWPGGNARARRGREDILFSVCRTAFGDAALGRPCRRAQGHQRRARGAGRGADCHPTGSCDHHTSPSCTSVMMAG